MIQRLTSLLRRSRAWVLTAVLGLVGILVAHGFDQLPYPLLVLKQAYNDAGQGGAVQGGTVSNFSAEDVANRKIVTYAISYGVAGATDPSKLGPLVFEDKLSASMTQVGSIIVPTNWGASIGGAGTVNYTGALLTPGSVSAGSPSVPVALATGSGGGDGYRPIVYKNGAVKRFFEIYHHQGLAGSINCQNFSDGTTCAGYPKPLTNGAPAPTSLGTPMWVHTVQIGTRLYYAANNQEQNIGIGCWDMKTDAACPYVALDPAGGARYPDYYSGNASIAGVMSIPSQPTRLYVAHWGNLFCWDTATNTACPGGATPFLAPTDTVYHFTPSQDQGHADLMVAGTPAAPDTMMFALTNGWLTCVDLKTWPATTCKTKFGNKWPIQVQSMAGRDHNILSQYLDASGVVIGTCATIDTGWGTRAPTTKCYDTTGTPQTTPGILTATYGNYFYVSTSQALGTRVYYPLPSYAGAGAPNGSTGATACWDFALNAACPGFTDGGAGAVVGLRRWNYPNAGSTTQGIVGATLDYGYASDGACMYGLGDSAKLWSFDPQTGTAPCNFGSDDIAVQDPVAFCDGQDHGSYWDRVEINNTPTEIRSVNVKVFDPVSCPAPTDTSNCSPLTTGQATPSAFVVRPVWTIPFANRISLKQYPRLRVTYTYTFLNGTPPTAYPNFSIGTYYTPDSTGGPTHGAIGQVCMRAAVNSCPAASIDNLAVIKSATTGNVLGRSLWTINTPFVNPDYSDTAPAVDDAASSAVRTLYRSTYQTTDWSGDITAYSTDANGNPTGQKPWSTGAAGANGGAAQVLPTPARRNILTAKVTGNVGTAEGAVFNLPTLTAIGGSLPALFGSNATDQTQLIDYLRGDRNLEARVGTSKPYRRRMLWDSSGTVTALGDFIHSAPIVAQGTVFASANDGMLHGFDANTGVESFAYLPQTVLSLLPATANVNYVHTAIMDGQNAVGTAKVGGSVRQVLVGSTGGIKPALYGIDVSGLPRTAPGPANVLFESAHAELGQATGGIQIVNLNSSTTAAFLGNGPGSTSNKAQLMVVNLATGVVSAISTNTGSASAPNHLSTPTVHSVGGKPVAVYAGDRLGNLWRFPISGTSISSPSKIFTTGLNQPITAAPTVSEQLTLDGQIGFYVYFGTGQPVDRTDYKYDPATPAEQAIQSQYGLFITLSNALGNSGYGPYTRSHLVAQSVNAATGKTSANKVDLKSVKGWYLDLDPGAALLGAERVLNPTLYNSRSASVAFLTAQPQKSGCTNASVALSHLFVIDAASGGPAAAAGIAGTLAGRINLTGTLGAISSGSGRGLTNAYTSNAGGASVPAIPDVSSDNGSISKVDLTGMAGVLKRTSWTQLY